MVLHGFAWRSSKKHGFETKKLKIKLFIRAGCISPLWAALLSYLGIYLCIFGFEVLFVGFCLKTLFFGVLEAKPCRTIMKLPQKASFGTKVCIFVPPSPCLK